MAKKEVIHEVVTYNPLLRALKENDKKNLFSTNITTAFIKTGFHLFDYYFGSVINIHDPNSGELIKQEARIGQAAGTFNVIVGNSGSGKTTMAIQFASNIIRQFKYSNIIHYDCEERMDISRAQTISQLPSTFFNSFNEDGARYIIKGSCGLDIMQESIVKLYVNKMKIKDQLLVNTGFKNEFNNDVFILEPTVIIIDSITSVLSETFSPDNSKEVSSAEKMRGGSEGARDAKTLKGFLKVILPLCKEANIIIYAINHINTNMSMNSFMPVAKQQNYLKQDEVMPGGKTMIYYPFNIIKLVAKPADDFKEETDGFSGHIVLVEPIKSSSNQSGNNSKGISFEMVFSFKHGFDPLRTLLLYAKKRGLIEGNNTRLKFKDDSSYSFSLKNINNDKNEKPIWEDVSKYVIPTLNDHLSFVELNDSKFDDRSMSY